MRRGLSLAAALIVAAAATPAVAQGAAPAAAQKPGPEVIPLEHGKPLAPASTAAPGTEIDGIMCQASEQVAYHIHVHLQVYVDGKPRVLPAAIGMVGPVSQQTQDGPFYSATKCYYWMHTHASDGVIHIESPTPRIYTLGEFFDEWGQTLTRHRVAGAKGKVTAIVNGKRWKKSARAIPLIKHSVIELAVGKPVPKPYKINWGPSQL